MTLSDRGTHQVLGNQPAPTASPPQAPVKLLSSREQEVLKLLAQGYTNKEIGTRLCLSVKTIETYRARLADKLGLRSRADFTRYALEVGLLNPIPSSPG
jgi:DNA-binding NarL/FixJ family response regulator